MIEELKAAMFLCGCRTVEEISKVPVVITGNTKEYLDQRGFDTARFARKK
jgi:isopentenyl-diphosphate Delta-isomerase